ncbi:MAG: tRNA (adenosine(37)-N6)-dimethylallyltransferase MiaA, partial [Clostridia bacterium]|nr:tRNA (adenosine(37)-N6)-dimethylallyltransferase MiaA [Clostridia bacterium]
LYINSILYPMQFAARGTEIREELQKEYELFGKEHMYEKLKSLDDESYNRLHINDTKRVMRAIEIALSGGKHSLEDIKMARYASLIIVLNAERHLLYQRINERVDHMLEAGLLDEVKAQYCNESAQSFQAIGYKELAEYLRGNCSYCEAVELLKKNTRNYAKRQLTWARQYSDAVWFDTFERSKAQKLAEDTFKNDNQR